MEIMKDLIKKLNEASTAYYKYDKPIMSDKQYDELYDRLVELVKSTGIIMANSPTQKVQGDILDELTKVKHSKPMLSAQKTKNVDDIKLFASKSDTYVSWKLDGLTIVVKYKNGKLVQALTRGSGDFGEDVTEQARMITNLPLSIPVKDELELRGECVISWDNFNKINETLEEKYSHPRNLAAGSIRQLNTSITKERSLEFVTFEVLSGYECDNKFMALDAMDELGFTTVDRVYITTKESVNDIVELMTADKSKFPVDGLIFEYVSNEYSKSLGATSHHESCRMALKWKDNTYETTLTDIEWSTSRTGLINPVAIFEPVDLDGAVTTRATLHNISYIEDLELGIGDIITLYRANMVIPKVDDNLNRSNTWKLPDKCPNCGGKVETHNDNGSETLHCLNPNCSAKLLGKLTHFVSKHAMNIDGMSEATLEFLIFNGWVNNFIDLYSLDNHKSEWMRTEGFGKKSVDNLLIAIENSRRVKLENFIYALGIPLIGRTASKDLSKFCNGYVCEFIEYIENSFDFSTVIDGFGNTMNISLYNWFRNNKDLFMSLLEEVVIMREEGVSSKGNNKLLEGKSICITGSLIKYTNRDTLVKDIELNGGKVVSGVTKKTDFLLTNDTTSGSSKNVKAKELGIPVITEEQFMEMIKK
jgi:DNA ligase (NAD+)